MPHISTERVKEIRNQLKKEFPDVKFSVTRKHYSSVRIAILRSKFDFDLEGRSYLSINPYYVRKHWPIKEQADFLQRIVDVASTGNEIESVDGDYGNIPTFYYDVLIGEFDKPYSHVNTNK
jgi:hypothetical protein